jgi:hypothetical protein
MSDKQDTLDLMTPVPVNDGECRRRVLHDRDHEDWVEVRVVLDGGTTGKRVVTALFDADDQPGTVSDVVTISGGQRQLAVSGQVAAGGADPGYLHGDRLFPGADRYGRAAPAHRFCIAEAALSLSSTIRTVDGWAARAERMPWT